MPDRADSHDEFAATVDRDALWSLLRVLPERQRAALVLRYFHDLPDDEISAALDCRTGTVRSLISRGLATMRQVSDRGSLSEEALVNDIDFEARLRASLSEHAANAPRGEQVVQRVLDDVEIQRRRPRPSPWRTWSVPLVAAGAVAAVVAALVVLQPGSHERRPPRRPCNRVRTSAFRRRTSAATSPSPQVSATQPAVTNAVGLRNFAVNDRSPG